MMPDGSWENFRRRLDAKKSTSLSVTHTDDLIIVLGTIKAFAPGPVRVFLRGDRMLQVELREQS